MDFKKQSFKNSLELILYFLRGSAAIFLLSMVFATVVSFLDMVLPRMISFTVDSVIGEAAPDLPAPLFALLEQIGGIAALRAHPISLAAAVIAVALAGALFRFLFRFCNSVAAERFVKRMRDSLYRKTIHLPYAWHGANSTGDIIQRCTSDVETIKVFVSEQLTSLVRVIVLIALAVTFMSRISGRMTLYASIFIPVMISYSLFFYSRIGGAFEKADTEEGRLSAIVQENLTGVRVVRAFGREQYERSRFKEQNEKYTGFWIHLMKILNYNWVAGDLLTLSQYLLVLVLGTVYCIDGHITAGQFIAFVSYNSLLTWPVRSLGRVISEMSKANISLERLRYIMNAEEEKDPEGAVKPPMHADISFRHVSYTYDKAAGEALHDVSFTIPAGTTLGILGGTGSGKSTLMYLLEKLYDLEEGTIEIGGVDIRQIDTPYLRSQVGMVLQEPYLFSRSLEENIRIAETEDTASRRGNRGDSLRRAARTASLLETVERFPSGFETFVGERGVTLSGGQKQRTAIAQMLIRDCPIMIFDDSLSAVDAETDAHIREALKRETGDATVILIAHRITTIMHADQILVLENGRVAERGTHEELLSAGGIYRNIYDLQLAGAEEAHEVAEAQNAAEMMQNAAAEAQDTAEEAHEAAEDGREAVRS
ncbi:MAG: ABC transporter ATP-binding protein [Lachnospiraceae bacterium]|nr:ABC transporter ATP-binding protein [Lachnospiraceae bacterium]